MKERPIIFSAPMVKAILAGAKTQTRRILKPNRWGTVTLIGQGTAIRLGANGLEWTPAGAGPVEPWPPERVGEVCPYGGMGDQLWVKETWGGTAAIGSRLNADGFLATVSYRADGERTVGGKPYRWRPSIYMPRWASRINLRIMNVWVERLHEITEEDAANEGLEWDRWAYGPEVVEQTPREAFMRLWDDLNGKRAAWKSNPWCWVVSFRRIS